MSILSSTYYDKLIGHVNASFVNLVQIGEALKAVLRPIKSRIIIQYLNRHRVAEGSTKKNFLNRRSEKNEKSYIRLLDQLPDSSSHMLSPFPSIN